MTIDEEDGDVVVQVQTETPPTGPADLTRELATWAGFARRLVRTMSVAPTAT